MHEHLFQKLKHCTADKTEQEHPADQESERTKTKSVKAFVLFFLWEEINVSLVCFQIYSNSKSSEKDGENDVSPNLRCRKLPEMEEHVILDYLRFDIGEERDVNSYFPNIII